MTSSFKWPISRFIERVQTTANCSLYGYLDSLGVFDAVRELGYWPWRFQKREITWF